MKISKQILLTSILAISSLLTSTASASNGNIFSDVNQDTKYYQAIEFLKNNDVVGGYPDGTFKPEQTLNRAELLKILIEATVEDEIDESKYKNCFPDVKEEWFAKYVCYGKEEGIVNGYPDGTFKPANEINFVEAAKIIVNSFGFEVGEDKEIWYKPYAEELTENKRVPRTIDNFSKNITRDEMAEMMWRIKEDIKKSEDWISYKGINIQMEHPEWFTEHSQRIKENYGSWIDMKDFKKKEFYPFEFWETDISELEHIFFNSINQDVFTRKEESKNFKIIFFAKTFHSIFSQGFMLIKNENKGKIFISNKPVWDAKITNDEKYIFLSWNESLDYFNISDILKNLLISKNEICKNAWLETIEADSSIITLLGAVNLSDMSIESTSYFGGQEIMLEEDTISFAQYTSGNNFIQNNNSSICENFTISPVNSCWHHYVDFDFNWSCKNLGIENIEIKISHINKNTFKKIKKDSTINTIGSLHDTLKGFGKLNNYIHPIDIIPFLTEIK